MCIKLNFQVFILCILFFVTKHVEAYSVVLLFIAVHELAHIIASLMLKFKISKVKINVFGFSVLLKKRGNNKELFDKLIIASVGPGINIVMSFIFMLLPLQVHIKELLVYSNILLGVTNLLPIFPLDGARILKEILSFKHDQVKVLELINKITFFCIIMVTVLSSVLILFYKNIGIFIGVIFLWKIVLSEYRNNRYRKIVYGVIKNIGS